MNFTNFVSRLIKFKTIGDVHKIMTPSRSYALPGSSPGSKSGRSGKAGGPAGEGGDGLGKFGAAREDGYFYDKQRKQLRKIKKKLKDNEETHDKKKH